MPAKVVDLGCGTGLLTRHARRARPGGDRRRSESHDARVRAPAARAPTRSPGSTGTSALVEPTGDADLVISAGNTIMHIGNQAEVFTALANALRPGGVISFESRNPAARAWEQWTREATYGERDTVAGHLVEWLDLIEVADGRVVFDAHNLFPDGHDAVYRNTLYFRSADAIAVDLKAAGFVDIVVRGGWHEQPLTDDSRLLVFHATRS